MFYEKVSDYCRKNGISIHELEKKCKIGNGTIGGWRNENSTPKLETLRKIAQATGIPIEEWIKENG